MFGVFKWFAEAVRRNSYAQDRNTRALHASTRAVYALTRAIIRQGESNATSVEFGPLQLIDKEE